MNHQETSALLHDLDIERLDARTRAAVESHLATCEECMELADVYRALRAAAMPDGAVHPSSDDVVTLAMHPEDLAESRRADLESHLTICERCAAEVRRVRTIEAGDDRTRGMSRHPGESSTGRSTRRTSPTPWLLAAAAILVAILVYPAYLGLVRLPDLEQRSDQAARRVDDLTAEIAALTSGRRQLEAYAGRVDLTVLSSSHRGSAERQRVEVEPDSSFVLLAFELLVPRAVGADQRVRFELFSDAGEAVWFTESTAGDTRDDVKSGRVVALVVPVAGLSSGDYELRATLPDRTGEPLAVLPFQLVRAP